MMLASNAAAGLNPRGLRRTFPGHGNALGRVRALAGMGLTDAEITAALVAGTASGRPGGAAYEARYGAGGSYLREASVIATYGDTDADKVADVTYNPVTKEWLGANPAYGKPPESSPPVNLYIAAQCGPSDYACIAENERRQQANLRIIENANRAFNLQACRYNSSINPETVNDRDCTGLYSPLPALVASGEMRMVASSGGSYSIPADAGTPAQRQAAAGAWTAQQAASAAANRPNQTVPPRPQPGEVPAAASETALERLLRESLAREAVGDGTGNGKILGLDPKVLALIAAGVGALMLLKK